MADTKIEFSYRNSHNEGQYRVFVGEQYAGEVYPEWGPWRPKVGWGPGTGVQECDQIGWIASMFHSVADKPGGDDLHVRGKTRREAMEGLWERMTAHGWDTCPVGKRMIHPWEVTPEHTCKPVQK